MKNFKEFLYEATIEENDTYKDLKYKIGDKVYVMFNNNSTILSGEVFNRTLFQGYSYCIKFDKKYASAGNGLFSLSEYPKKIDKDFNSYWMPNDTALIFNPDIDKENDKYEYIYIKDISNKERKKCENPTQKNTKHTWNCKYCKGTGYITPLFDKTFLDLLKDKEFIYQEYKKIEGFKPFYIDSSPYWYGQDEIIINNGNIKLDNITLKEDGRFKMRPKPKQEEDPYKDNWWFINSEKKSINKKRE
jgi:hypothetical protein